MLTRLSSGNTVVLATVALVAGLLGGLLLLSSCGSEIPGESQWMNHVRTLADDHLMGRDAITPGFAEASEYVARELKRYGVAPAGDSASFFQRVPLVARSVDEENCSLALVRGKRAVPLRLGEDAVLSMRVDHAATIDAPLVFVGYGMQAPEAGYDDLAGLNLKGAVAVVLRSTPASLKGEIRAHASHRGERWRALRRAGAIGMIYVAPPRRGPARWNSIAYTRFQPGVVLEGREFDEVPGMRVQLLWNSAKAKTLFRGARMGFDEIARRGMAGEPLPRFSLPHRLRMKIASHKESVASRNVVGVIRGSDKKLRDQYVVLTAHLDHLGVGFPVEGDSIYNGALDNASGCATLLEIARMIGRSGHPPKRSVLFLFTTAEESGLWGSAYFASRPTVPAHRIVANLNIDMFLPIQPIRGITAYGMNESDLGDVLRQVAKAESLKVVPDPRPEETIFVRSDQYPFIKKGIPALMLDNGPTTDRADSLDEAWRRTHYHEPSDDAAQTIDLGAVACYDRFALALTRAVADRPQKPRWREESFFRRYANGNRR
jgi:hypothetical protein